MISLELNIRDKWGLPVYHTHSCAENTENLEILVFIVYLIELVEKIQKLQL